MARWRPRVRRADGGRLDRGSGKWWGRLRCSALTSNELGASYGGAWHTITNSARHCSEFVCGESNNGFNTDNSNLCFGGSVAGGAETAHGAWVHASGICLAIGSRLYTVAELQAEETRGFGCQHDKVVWASDSCANGHMTAVGGNHNGQNRCVDTSECTAGQNPCTCIARCYADANTEPAVRCFADVAGPGCNAPPGPSGNTVAEVGIVAADLSGVSAQRYVALATLLAHWTGIPSEST